MLQLYASYPCSRSSVSVLGVAHLGGTKSGGFCHCTPHRPYGQYTLGPLPMDHVDPARMRADYDCLPQDEFHGDGLTKVHNTRGIITQPRSTCAVPAPPPAPPYADLPVQRGPA